MSTGAFTLADVDKPKGQFTQADLDESTPAPKKESPYGEGTIVNNRLEGGVAKALSGAGLPTSLANVPDWLRGLKNLNISHLFIEPIRKAVDEPTQENIVGAVPFIGTTSVSMAKDVREGRPEEALGTLAGTVAALKGSIKGAPKAGEVIGNTASQAREGIGAAIHDEEGNLKPGYKAASKIGGGLTGAAAGATVGHEYLGAAAGYKMGPSLMESIFPEPANAAEARAQAELYQSKAEDLVRRGKEQEALDRKQAAATRLAARNAPKPTAPDPFSGGTSSANPQYTGDLPKGNATPFNPNVKLVDKFQIPEKSKIVSPDSPPPNLKTTYQSYPRAKLYQMGLAGDVEALRELIRNPGGYPLPPNAKFLLEDAGRKPWRNADK